MAVDRAGEAEPETADKPPAPPRRPPPDNPGAAQGPSRADSRAGAAAANRAPADGNSATASRTADDSTAGEGCAAGSDTSDEAEPAGDESVPTDTTEMAEGTADDSGTPEAGDDDDSGGTGSADDAAEGPSDATGEVPDGIRDEAADERPALAGDGPEVPVVEDDPQASPKPPQPIGDAPASGPRREPVDPIETTGRPAGPSSDGRSYGRSADISIPRVEPLDDRAYTEHTRRVEAKINEALGRGESTDVRHTLDAEHTIWAPDRAEIHQQIIDEFYSAAADVPNDGQAIVAGGLGGAGKSTTLEDHAGIDRSKYLTINPDDLKEALGRRGLIPHVEGLAPMERSALVHEESAQIARSLAGRAYADRKNVIWDITMSSRSSVAKRIQQLREAGYTNIAGIFVHIPVDKSIARAEARHRQGLEDHRNGEILGGRYVPPDVIRANTDPVWGSVNRGVFEDLKPEFDGWKLYDNSVDGREPVLLDSSGGPEKEHENE